MTGRCWVGLAVLAIALLSGCGAPSTQATGSPNAPLGPVSLAGGEKLRVVATTTIVGDSVKRIGGDHVVLTTLMGIGVDPHSYVPVSADTAAIHDAHVLFSNGAGLEEGLAKLLEGAGGSAVRIQLADGLVLRPEPASSEAPRGSGVSAQREMDPHVWFDVQNVILWAASIERALSVLDPGNSADYAANAQAYTAELQALDSWIVGQVSTIPQDRRLLVTNHPVLGYFAARYGFTQEGSIYPLSPSAEPSARDVAALEDTIRKARVGAVFVESTVSPKLAQQVAQDTGVKLVPLFTDSLGGPGSGAESYIAMMRFDVTAIVDALR